MATVFYGDVSKISGTTLKRAYFRLETFKRGRRILNALKLQIFVEFTGHSKVSSSLKSSDLIYEFIIESIMSSSFFRSWTRDSYLVQSRHSKNIHFLDINTSIKQ